MSLRLTLGRCRAALRAAAVALLAATLLVALGAAASGSEQPGAPLVDVIEVDGTLDPSTARYVRDTIAKANADGADLVVVQLDTPGALGGAGETVTAAVRDSGVPVLAFVGNAGARAYGAGAAIALSAHLLAVAPVTQLGAAAPADLRAGVAPPAQARALGEELAAIAAERGRDPEFARATATRSQVLVVPPPTGAPVAVPEQALPPGAELRQVGAADAVGQGLVDAVEPSLSAALNAVRGTQVTLADGSAHTIAADDLNARVRFNNPGVVVQLLHTVADPTVAYLLLVAAALAVAFEVFQPGFGVAGVSALLMGGLGLYGLAVLAVSWPALALLLLGVVLLALDLAIGGLGPPTFAGTAAFAAGSWWLFGGPALLDVSPWLIGLCTAFAVLFFVVIMTVVLRAQGGQARAGADAVVGQTGVVRSMLNPEGHVFVQGALWRARAPERAGRVPTGTVVRVTGLDDRLTLEVELVEERATTG